MANSNNSRKFFGFALADSMFREDCVIQRRTLTADEVRAMAKARELTPCLNPSHAATIDAMRQRYGIDIAIPATPPKISLGDGDSVVVMGVRGLPRLTDRHEYTPEEIKAASFSFSEYTISPVKYYLVGEAWYSGDQGDYPNASTTPSFSTSSLEEAEERYQELSKNDSSWSYGFRQAYLVEVGPDGIHPLRGKWSI